MIEEDSINLDLATAWPSRFQARWLSKEKAMRRTQMLRRAGVICAVALIAMSALALPGRPVGAQSGGFSSGSTGMMPFNATTNQSVQLPLGGVLQYTSVNIASGATITFIPDALNSPVTILASGNVTISGNINIFGQSASSGGAAGLGGPGGFNGGAGGSLGTAGTNGSGPGGGFGGAASNGTTIGSGSGAGYFGGGGSGETFNPSTGTSAGAPGGPAYGSATLLPLIGGSGGGGGGSAANGNGGGGGGGGGAILIASSQTIDFSGGNIFGTGGNGANGTGGAAAGLGGGGGAGAGIRLVANAITGNNCFFEVPGGSGGSGGGGGAPGFVRAEAYSFTGFSPSLEGATAISTSMAPNPPTLVGLAGAPTFAIASVGGVSAPSAPLGSLSGPPDIVLPSLQANPVTVSLVASGIPLTPVPPVAQVTVVPAIGASATVASTNLTGTTSSSSAQASVTLPAGMSVITATITISLPTLADMRLPSRINGEPVEKVEIAATFGGKSRLTYITQSGKRIPAE
jgi:hypothetical protein